MKCYLQDDAGNDVLEGLLKFSQAGKSYLHDRIDPSVDLHVDVFAVTEGHFYCLLHNGGDLVNDKLGLVFCSRGLHCYHWTGVSVAGAGGKQR